MSQIPADGDAYLDPEGNVVPLNPDTSGPAGPVSGATRPRTAGGELVRNDKQEPASASALDKKIEKLARKRVKARQDFRAHLTVYLAVMALLWFIWAAAGGGFPWPGIPMLGWGIGIVAHWRDLRDKENEQAEVDAEIQRIRQRRGLEP